MDIASRKVEWRSIDNKECLKITCNGHMTSVMAKNMIQELANLLNNKNGKFNIVFECKTMTGYDPMARNQWQKIIKELKDNIESIWVISESKVIMAGASILGIFTSFKIRTVSTETLISL